MGDTLRLEAVHGSVDGPSDDISCKMFVNDSITIDGDWRQVDETAWQFNNDTIVTSYSTEFENPLIYPGDEVKKQVKDLGADGFFSKPFKSADLLIKIKKLIGE